MSSCCLYYIQKMALSGIHLHVEIKLYPSKRTLRSSVIKCRILPTYGRHSHHSHSSLFLINPTLSIITRFTESACVSATHLRCQWHSAQLARVAWMWVALAAWPLKFGEIKAWKSLQNLEETWADEEGCEVLWVSGGESPAIMGGTEQTNVLSSSEINEQPMTGRWLSPVWFVP